MSLEVSGSEQSPDEFKNYFEKAQQHQKSIDENEILEKTKLQAPYFYEANPLETIRRSD